ncbi:hypothetical protein BJ165DRAFT_1319764, partial [Panaeolus papilionaceus]
LCGRGDWEEELRVLADADIRSYQDPNKLKRSEGRKGTLTDEQLAQLKQQGLEDDEDEDNKRDGTGETGRTISWIWLGRGASTKNMDADKILQAEWAKSRARVLRAKEEVPLLKEEMRRVLQYLEWKAKKWLSQAQLRRGMVDSTLQEGLNAYAHQCAAHQRALAAKFKKQWHSPLK